LLACVFKLLDLFGFEDFYPVMKWKWRLLGASIRLSVAREWNDCDNSVWYSSENKQNVSYPGLRRLKVRDVIRVVFEIKRALLNRPNLSSNVRKIALTTWRLTEF
jgi:hypothetical protein